LKAGNTAIKAAKHSLIPSVGKETPFTLTPDQIPAGSPMIYTAYRNKKGILMPAATVFKEYLHYL
jgi:hypothetical protein